MMSFRDALSLWLGSHGLSFDEAEQVLNDRKMALCLKMLDPGGVRIDMPEVLHRLHTPAARVAAHAIREPGESLQLMALLRSCGKNAARQSSRAQRQSARPARGATKPYSLNLLMLENRAAGTEQWFVLLGESRKPLSEAEVRKLAAAGSVDSGCLWMSDSSRMQVGLISAGMPQVMADLGTRLGFKSTSATRTSVRSVQEHRGYDDRAGGLELELLLSASDYLAFFERAPGASA